MSEAAIALPHRAPYTVDDLFELPDDGNRYEVFGGSLVMSPAPASIHQIVSFRLQSVLWPLVAPLGALALATVAVRLSADDGPLPDLTVVSAGVEGLSGAVPVEAAFTVVEIVSPGSAFMDRSSKPELYAEAGIPCYWRVELRRSRRHRGPFPLIVVQTLDEDGSIRTTEGASGSECDLPLAAGRNEWLQVRLDPATLVDR